MKRIFLIVYFFAALFLFVAPLQTYAAIGEDWTKTKDCIDPTTKIATLKCIPAVFNNLIQGALIFVGAVAIILIIYAGIRLGMSGGDPKQVQAARQIITYALLGLVLVLSSFAIIFFISYLTGAHCIEKLGSCT